MYLFCFPDLNLDVPLMTEV